MVCVLVLLTPRPSEGVADPAESAYGRARDRYHRNLNNPRENNARNWDRAIALFESVARDFPGSHWADDALYSVGLSYQEKGDPKRAVAAFERMASVYPGSRLADDALIMAGSGRIQLGDVDGGERDLLEVVRSHGKTDMYERARDRLVTHYLESGDDAGAVALLALLSESSRDAAARRNLEVMARSPEVAKGSVVAEATSSGPAGTPGLPPALAPAPKLVERGWSQEPDRMVDVAGEGRSWLESQGRPYVEAIKSWSSSRSTRIVLELSESTEFLHHRIENPDRIYVDLVNAVVYDPNARVLVNDAQVASVRSSQFDPSTARVVLEPREVDEYAVFRLSDPPRIVVDLRRSGEALGPELHYGTPTEPASLAQELGLRVRTIAIDPGHGGRDPGALGSGGLKEKDVTLRIAKELERRLESQGHFDAFLTRDDDRFIPLEERTAMANQRGADLFLSVHINAHASPARRGYETYYLAMAQDEEARAVAAFENATVMKSLGDLEGLLEGILRGAKRDESRQLAERIQGALATGMGGVDRGVKRAAFVVLVGADMPAVLTECGFITNPGEGGALREAATVEKIADTLYQGVLDYARSLTLLAEEA